MFWKKKDISPVIAALAKSFANGEREFVHNMRFGPYDFERNDLVRIRFKETENAFCDSSPPLILVTFPAPYLSDEFTKSGVVTFGDGGAYPLTADERCLLIDAYRERRAAIERHRNQTREYVLGLLNRADKR